MFDNLSTGTPRVRAPARRASTKATSRDAAASSACIADFRPEVVDHHAAQIDVRHSVDDPLHDARTNMLGTLTCSRLRAPRRAAR